MTTRDDLASRLRIKADMISLGERITWGSDSEIMREAATALEAKDAEIAEWRQAASVEAGLRREFLARAEAAESRITDLERQLAEETERCALVAEDHESTADDRSFDGNIQWHEGNDSACHRIAAAIRGGAK